MLKVSCCLLLLFLPGLHIIAQLPTAEDYKVYSAVINSEITDSTRQVVIIKTGIDSQETLHNTLVFAQILFSAQPTDKQQVYSWTENAERNRPSVIDSNSARFFIDYCNHSPGKFTLRNQFRQSFKTLLIKWFPVRTHSVQEDWQSFYEQYPGCGGIFSFAGIKYYPEGNMENSTAVLYYSVRRNGFNGHGALAVMQKKGAAWQIKYKTYLWWN